MHAITFAYFATVKVQKILRGVSTRAAITLLGHVTRYKMAAACCQRLLRAAWKPSCLWRQQLNGKCK